MSYSTYYNTIKKVIYHLRKKLKYQPISGKVCNAMGVDIYTCCSSNNQCGRNQGDCDSDNDCSGNLVCGTGNCLFPFPLNADCCTGNS